MDIANTSTFSEPLFYSCFYQVIALVIWMLSKSAALCLSISPDGYSTMKYFLECVHIFVALHQDNFFRRCLFPVPVSFATALPRRIKWRGTFRGHSAGFKVEHCSDVCASVSQNVNDNDGVSGRSVSRPLVVI